VEVKPVAAFVAALLAIGIVIFFVLAGLFFLFADRERARKETDLPPVAVPSGMPKNQPKLEEVEDLEKGRVQLFPPRAAWVLEPEEKLLDEGGKRALPIQEAIADLAGKLPSRGKPKQDGPPANFQRQLPSKASSGRTDTGGL
jgi:hypothetical protein